MTVKRGWSKPLSTLQVLTIAKRLLFIDSLKAVGKDGNEDQIFKKRLDVFF